MYCKFCWIEFLFMRNWHFKGLKQKGDVSTIIEDSCIYRRSDPWPLLLNRHWWSLHPLLFFVVPTLSHIIIKYNSDFRKAEINVSFFLFMDDNISLGSVINYVTNLLKATFWWQIVKLVTAVDSANACTRDVQFCITSKRKQEACLV